MRKLLQYFWRTAFVFALTFCASNAFASVYLNETFDALANGIPEGWSSGGDITQDKRFAAYQYGYSGRCLRFNSTERINPGMTSGLVGKKEILMTPAVEVSGNVTVSFWYRNQNAGEFAVYVSRDNGATYENNVLLPPTTTGLEWTLAEYAVPCSRGDQVRVVFVATSNGSSDGAYIYLDEVKVEDVPTCAKPVNLSIYEATTTSATFMWNILANAGAAPSEYILELWKDGVKVHSETVPDQMHTLTNLEAGTAYTLLVKGDCNYVYQLTSPTASITFTTPCAPLPLPYSEDFNDQRSGLLPCWTTGGTNPVAPALQTNYKAGANGAAMKIMSTEAYDSYAISPTLHTMALENLEVSFKAFAIDHSQTVEVGVVTNPYDFATYAPIGTFSPSAGSWEEYVVNTSALVDAGLTGESDFYVVFNAQAGIPTTYFIDDLSVAVPDACPRPTGFKATAVAANSITLAWEESATPTARTLSYSVVNSNGESQSPTTAPVTTNPYTLAGLQPNTTYKLFLTLTCGDETSLASSTLTVTTPCEPTELGEAYEPVISNALPECWTAVLSSSDRSSGAVYPNASGSKINMQKDNLLAVCGFGVDAKNLRLSFTGVYTPANSTSSTSMVLEVGIMTDINDPNSFTTVHTVTLEGKKDAGGGGTSGVSTDFELLMDAVPADGEYIAFRSGDACSLSKIKIDLIPECISPVNLRMTGYGKDYVEYAWDSRRGVTSYKVKINGEEKGTVEATSYRMENLTPGASYTHSVEVISVCNGNEGESTNESFTFTTYCDPLTVTQAEPYSVSFGDPDAAYPSCWEIVNENPKDPHSGSYHLHSTSEVQMLALPGFTNPLADLRLSLLDLNIYSGNILVGYVTELTNPDSFVEIDRFTATSGDITAYSYTVAYPSCPDGAYMALAADEMETSQIILSRVKVDLKPTCVSTVKVSNHESTTTSIGISLGSTQSETAWDIVIVPSGQSVTDGEIQTFRTTNPSFTGLTPGTNYDIYVRPNCGEGCISDWTGPYTAATLCEISQIPYLMDFSAGLSPCYTVSGSVKWEVSNKWGNMAANLASSEGDGSSALLITGEIDIPEGKAALLTFDMYRGADDLGNYYNPAKNLNVMKVYVNTTPSLQGAQLLRTINNSYLGLPAESSMGMHTYTASIPVSGENIYVIFEQVMNTYDAGLTDDWMNPQDRQVSTIDNIRVEEADGCFTPFIVSVQASTSTATIKAKGSSSATEYRFTIGEETRTSETNTIIWNGLLPDMEYTVTVSTECGTDAESEVSVPYTFRTRCTALTSPVYTDGFEDGLTQLLCWTTSGKLETVTTAYEGGAALSLSAGYTYLLPEMEITDVKELELSFMAYGLDLTNQMTIGVAKDANDIAGTFSSAKTITVKDKNKWREIVVTFETVGEDYKDAHFIAINMPSGQNVIIDNVKVGEKSACPKVTNMNVVVYGDELAVTWESSAPQTEFLLTKNGEEIKRTTVTNDQDEDVQSTTLQWVEQNTAGYVLTARSVCDGANSDWTAPYVFRTPCNRVETLPYTQNFENLGLTAESFTVFPECWTKVVMNEWSGTDGKMLPALSYKDGYTVGKVALWMWDECMVALPEMMEPIGNLTLTFKAYCVGQEGKELEVGVLESLDQPDAFVLVKSIPKVEGEFVEFEVNFTGYTGRYIALRTHDGDDYRLDDFKVSITPNCLRPTGVTVTSVTETTANLSIVDPSDNTSWEVVMVPTGVDVSEGNVQTFESLTGEYTGLQGSKIYDVYVRGCKGSDKSEWMKQPSACRTDCASGSLNLPFSESFEDVQTTNLESMYISECWTLKQIAQGEQGTGTDYEDEAWSLGTAHVHGGTVAATLLKGRNGARTLLISPKLNVPTANAYEVVFWIYRQEGTTKDLEGVRVWTNYQQDTVGGQMLAYVPHYGGIKNDESVNTVDEAGWYEYAVVIPQADNALYVIFEGISQGGADIYMDDIEIRAIPSCRKPERVLVEETDPTSVTITIDDPVGTKWDVAVMKRDSLMEDGFQPVVSRTVEEKTPVISGLQPASDYDLYVRANCGGGEVSDWTSLVQFSTTCVAKTVTSDTPFTDNFDAYEAGSMPLCWSTPLYNAVGLVVYPMVERGPMSYYYWNSRTCLTLNNCIAVLPEFTNDVRDLVISFDYAGYGIIELGVMTDPLDMNTFVPLYELDAEANTTVQFRAEAEASMLNFLQYEGAEAHYIAFRVQESNSLLIDDVVVSLYSDCEAPQSVVVKDVTSESATIELSDLRTNFDYAVVEAGDQVTVESIVAANEPSLTYSVNDLQGSTTYDVYVRAYCDGQPGYWSKPVSFTTLCGVETVTEENPYVVFETLTETDNCYTVLSGSLRNYGANYGNYVTASTVLLLPEFTNSLSDLEIYVETGSSANFKMEAGFLTDPSDASTFVVGGDLVLADRNSSGTVSAGTLQPTSNLAIRIVGADSYNSGRYSSAYVKKIQVQMKQGFFLPKNLSVSELTHNSATVTAEIGRETTECKWRVNNVEQAETTEDGVLVLSNLSEQTEYTVEVMAKDANGMWTTWSEPVVFTTLCAPKTLPYSETFDAEEMPACWDFSQQVTLSSGSIALQAGDYAIVPVVDAALSGTQISVTYTAAEGAQLSVGSMNGTIDTYTALQNLAAASESTTAVVSLKNVPAGHTNIVLMVTDGTATVEEVTVDVLGGSCYAPTNIELVSFTNMSAKFTWQAGNTEAAWNVTCTVNGEVKESVLVETTPSYELTGLTAGTDHEVKVSITSACDEASSVASEASFSFTTECDLLTITEDVSYVADFSAGMPDCWTDVVPGTNFSGGKLGMTGSGEAYIVALPGYTNDLSTLTLLMTAGPNGSEQESMELGYITNVLDPSTFVAIETLDLGSMSTTVKSFELDLSEVSASGARLALRANPKYGLSVYNLEIALTPTIERPEVKAVATRTSIDLTITAAETATEAEVVVVEAGADRSTGIVNKVTLSNGVGTYLSNGLEEATDYDIYVRVSSPSKSFWTELSKSTLCYTGSLPYLEDFNGFMSGVSTDFEYSYGTDPKAPTNPTYPDCWTFLNITDPWGFEGPWAFLADIEGQSYDGVSLYLGNSYGDDIYAVLPSVGVETRELRLSLKYRTSGDNMLIVGVMSDPNDASTFVQTAKLVNQQTYTEASVSFDNAPEGYDYVAIKHLIGSGMLWIDDVRLSCVSEPETVSATICSGEEFVHAGVVISADQLVPGLNEIDYVQTSMNDGCDKRYHFEITVDEPAETIMKEVTVCSSEIPYEDDEYDFSIERPQTMRYYLELPADEGDCAQLVCLDMKVENPIFTHTASICKNDLPYEFEINGVMEQFTESGVYDFEVELPSGCDSIVRVDLTVNHNIRDEYRTICEGESVLFQGKQHTESGDYVYPLGTYNTECGEDTAILHLTVLPLEIHIDTTICPNGRESDGIWFGERFITEPGNYNRQYLNELECEVTEYLYVKFTELEKIEPEVVEICYNEPFDGYQHTDGRFYGAIEAVTKDTTIAIIIGATNDYCGDSLYQIVHPIIIEPTERDTVVTEAELPFQFGGVSVSGAGTFKGVFESAQGCDSIVYLNVTLNTGLQMVHAGDLTLRPNPVQRNHEIAVDYQFTAQERDGMRIEVVNSIGQVISIQTQVAEQVTVNPIPVPGFYTIRIVTGDDKYYTAKVLVK